MNNKEFLQKIKNSKNNILIFGKAGVGGPTIIQEYMKKKKGVK